MKKFHSNLGAFVSWWLKNIRHSFFFDLTGRLFAGGSAET
jgi:hypothetical protein